VHSTQTPKQTDDPHDVLVVAPDVVLVAPADEELAKLAHTLSHPSNPHARTGSRRPGGSTVPPIDTTFRAAAVRDVQVRGDRPSIGRRAVRVFSGFLLVTCISVAGIAWQSYGDAAKQIIARWAPQLVLTSSPPLETPGLPEQANPPTIQASAAKAAPPQPAPLAQTAPEGVAPKTAALSPESAQLLQSMAGDLATAGQEIKQLKASIEQLKASIEQLKASTEQLKASQEQMSRDIAKDFEQNLRPKISTSAPRSAPAPARKLMPPFPPPLAVAAPRLPQAAAPSVPQQSEPQPQATAQPEAESVPRPPMPMR
jgi:hypothetical protein